MTNLFLRTTDAEGRSHGGFQWPLEIGATVTAPDWDPAPKCGNGLHGLMDGLGQASHLSFDDDAIWWIVEAADAVDLGGKHKFQSCRVVAFGPRHEATAELHRLRPGPIHGLALTGGDGSTLTGGDRSTLIFLRWVNSRRRVLTAYVGEGGIKPGVAYRANADHTAVVEATQ